MSSYKAKLSSRKNLFNNGNFEGNDGVFCYFLLAGFAFRFILPVKKYRGVFSTKSNIYDGTFFCENR